MTPRLGCEIEGQMLSALQYGYSNDITLLLSGCFRLVYWIKKIRLVNLHHLSSTHLK